MGYYTGVLVSGLVDEEGNIAPDDNLVFHVEGDLTRYILIKHLVFLNILLTEVLLMEYISSIKVSRLSSLRLEQN